MVSLEQQGAPRLNPIRWFAFGAITTALVAIYCWFAVRAIPFFRSEPPSFVLVPMPVISGLAALLIYPSLQPERSFFRRFIRLYLGFFITLVVYGCYLWWLIPDGNPWLIAGSLFTGHWLGLPPFLLLVALYWLTDRLSRAAAN